MHPLTHRLADLVAQLGEVRATLCPLTPDARLIAAALNDAEGHLLGALAMASHADAHVAAIILDIARAERAGDIAEVDRLLALAAERARARRATIAGEGFAVHPDQCCETKGR